MSMNIDPEVQAIVAKANKLIAKGKNALEALEEIAPAYDSNGNTLYQRIRMQGGRLEKRFILPGAAAKTAA